MQPALVLFTGIRFPFYLAEQAVKWARQHRTGLHALFLLESEKEEGYLFPNDLDAAERLTTARDANHDDRQLITSRIKVLKDLALEQDIAFDFEVIYNPSIDQVLQKANAASQVFVDGAGRPDDQPAFEDSNFEMEKFIRQTPVPLERVAER